MAPEVAYSALGRACVWLGGGDVWGLDRRAWSRVVALLRCCRPRGGGVFGGVGFGGRGAHGSLDLVEIYEMSLWTYV